MRGIKTYLQEGAAGEEQSDTNVTEQQSGTNVTEQRGKPDTPWQDSCPLRARLYAKGSDPIHLLSLPTLSRRFRRNTRPCAMMTKDSEEWQATRRVLQLKR